MPTAERIRESVVIRVDFVRAGEARLSARSSGSAKIIDLELARLVRCNIGPHPAHSPKSRLPRGGAPGGFGGPF